MKPADTDSEIACAVAAEGRLALNGPRAAWEELDPLSPESGGISGVLAQCARSSLALVVPS